MPRRPQPARGRAPDPELKEEIPIPLLQAGEVELAIPPFFVTPNKGKSIYKWKLVNPLTKIRTIAQRQGSLAIKPTRAVNVKKPMVGFSFVKPRPTMGDFSPEDRAKLEEYSRRYEANKESEELVPAEPIENKQRGFPPVLFKNAERAGLSKSHTSKTYYEPPPIPIKTKAQKKRGRPKKGKPSAEPVEEAEQEAPSVTIPSGLISMEEFEAKSPLAKSNYLDKLLKDHPDITIRAKTKREKTGGEFIFGNKPEGYKGKLNRLVSSNLPKGIYEELYVDFLRQISGGGAEAPPKIREAKASSPPKEVPSGQKKAPREKKVSKKEMAERLFGMANLDTREGLEGQNMFELLESAIKYKESGTLPTMKRAFSKGSRSFVEKVKYLAKNYSASRLEQEFKKVIGDDDDDEDIEGGDLSGFAKKLIYGRKEFSPSAKRVLEANGTAVITGLELHRNPLPSLYQKTLSFLSGGETDKILADRNKDKLFHLSLWAKLSNGRTVKIDKTSSVGLSLSPKAPKQEESLEVKPVPPNLTLNDFLNKALQKVGVDKFFSYNAETNNCSDFIEMLLEASGLWKEPSISFVEQPAKEILGRFGLLSKVVKGITDIGERADILMEGGDIDAQKQHIIHGSGVSKKVDWEDLKWGSFTNQFHQFQQEHPDSKIDSLTDFARMILENPDDYRKTTKNRARFYLNVLLKQKSHSNNIMRGRGISHAEISHSEMSRGQQQHPALQSDLFPRIPQAYSQVYFSHPHPIAIQSADGHFATRNHSEGKPVVSGEGLADREIIRGLGKNKFPKGSAEMKEHMKKMREMRGKKISGGLIPSPPSRSPTTDPSLI